MQEMMPYHLDEWKHSTDPELITKGLRLCTGCKLNRAGLIIQYHDLLLFNAAFPCNKTIFELAQKELNRIAKTVEKFYEKGNSRMQTALMGSGIIHSELCCNYSLLLAKWIVNNFPDSAEPGSADADPGTVSEIFQLLLPQVEFERTMQGKPGLNKRIEAVSCLRNANARLKWLLELFENNRLPLSIKETCYNNLKINIRWKLDDPFYNRTFIRLAPKKLYFQKSFIKPSETEKIIKKKLNKPEKLNKGQKQLLAGIMKASLAFLYRETDPVTYADENEMELFDMGRGLHIGISGMQKDKRFSLESYIGFMAFKNGIPVSYGGGWLWGTRCKIGVNIFPAFRRGESAWLFCEVMRLYYAYFGARHFIVKPYQFGKHNSDGIKSGAFWFYYKLGFRPEAEALKNEAALEWEKIKQDRHYRSASKMLLHFTSSPVELIFPASNSTNCSAEKISSAITEKICNEFNGNRNAAINISLRQFKKKLPDIKTGKMNTTKKAIISNWALVSLLLPALSDWNQIQKKNFAWLIFLKHSGKERDYIIRLQQHSEFWKGLELI